MDSKNGVVGFYNMSSRTCGNFTKRRPEDGDGRNSTTEECDSTTEPVHFRVGEEVFCQDGEDMFFGTVGLIQGKRIKIIYDDGTEKWSTINKLKKVSPVSPVKEEVEEVKVNSFPSTPPFPPLNDGLGLGSSGSKKKTNSKCDLNGQVAPKESHQATCGSCGTQKIITRKKAMEYSPYTSHQYNCRKCINKSKTSKNNGVPIMAAAHYLVIWQFSSLSAIKPNNILKFINYLNIFFGVLKAANSRQRPRTSETNGGMDPNKARMLEQGIANGVVYRSETDICLHCRKEITEKVSLHCTMCERPCHPSCLALTPPPLPGDIFWSIICHVCGTQRHNDSPENDSQKLYSSRRSISSWSDVAYLLLSCLGCRNPTEKFFDLDKQIIPFWEENVSGLHLPRQYKTAQDLDRRNNLLLALTNASLRFLKDDKKKSESWSIKENTTRSIQVWKTIKPPTVSAGRGTIATQAAANKANNQGVPSPKNSPSHISPKSSSTSTSLSSLKSSGAPIGPALGKKGHKDQIPVAKKTGSELNNGVQWKNNIWPQSKYSGTKFLQDLPKTNINAVLGNPPVGESMSNNNPPMYPTVGPSNRLQQIQQQQKHTAILQPSPGGAARVTGMMIQNTSSSSSSSATLQAAEVGTRVGSYPVRKNGSPQLSKSIRVEPVERKKEVDLSSNSSFNFGGDNNKKSEELIRESPGFNNNQSSQQRPPAKRKLSLPAKPPTESSSASTSHSRTDEHELTSVAKKVKLSLPSSTDVTSKRLPSAPDSSGKSTHDYSTNTNISQKRDRSPLQRLTDLLRIGNGVLTIARVKQTEYGTQSEPLIPSTLADAMDQTQGVLKGRTDALASLTYDKAGQGFTSPIKNSIGATLTNGPSSSSSSTVQDKREENTKDKTNNVTTSPRVFKHASVSTPGASPSKSSSPVAERRMRPVRLKRAVVTNAQAEKQSKESSAEAGTKVGKNKVNGKTGSVAAVAAAALSHAAKTRGRPKKIFRQLVARRPVGNNNGFLGQFNGSVDNKIESASTDTVNESEFTWGSSTIKDLVEHGHGYRLGVLPRVPEGKTESEEVRQSAIKHIRDELAPRPPSYWSTSSTLNHSKKSANQKSRRDLKDVDSYYISGCRKDASGVQYQVVWRDGQGFECSSDDEEEMGIEFGSEYMYFEDYDFMEYFFDKMPVVSNEDDCDIDMEEGGETSGVEANNSVNGEVAAAVKAEPSDAERTKKNGKKWTEKELSNVGKIREETEAQSLEPIIIDLTDSP
ncbi:PHD finger protein 1 [Orchesella cincta]|uniref:PHD finger protein 1 n=1 Tax=Orchesella cincta TaxID=48709 RepID=A0A1D2MXB2_ORCCI|nr:PHD finger protein 1 [Orchesella cincta]